MRLTYDAIDIANWFLIRHNMTSEEQSDEQFNPDPITHLKLQKLLYYAQGIYGALNGKKLFENKIVAWEHGPVVQDIWEEYRGQKELDFTPDYGSFTKINEDKDAGKALEAVYDYYGKFSAWYLRNKTHEERPWLETPRNSEIEFDLIKEYFEQEVVS